MVSKLTRWARGLLLVPVILGLTTCVSSTSVRQLSTAYLTGSTQLPEPVASSEFTPGPEPSQYQFQGILSLSMTRDASHIEILKDTFKVTEDTDLKVPVLPSFSIELVQHQNTLLPLRRGPQRTEHPYWEYLIEPGRVWQESADGDWSRASLPFTLKEFNQNCLHNGVLTFLFRDDGSISRVAYQIGSETCQYLQVNLWGAVDAQYIPQKSDHADAVIADWSEELAARPDVKPLSELGRKFTGFNPEQLLPQANTDITVYGVIVDGVHYRSNCPTRFGPYPYCDEIDLPSYSLAKSIFAGLAYMVMARQWPGFEDLPISSLVPECRLPDGRWDDVTSRQLLNMTSGNYITQGYPADEDAAVMTAFFLAESHAEKLKFSCETWPRQQAPGSQLAYHTTDHYLLGSAMNAFLRQKLGSKADIFHDLIDEQIFKPLHMSPTSRVTQRSYDAAKQAFTAYGLFFKPADIALLAGFLNAESSHPELFRQQDFDTALFRDTAEIMRWPHTSNEAYKLGFWGFDISQFLPCSTETWIPFMTGYGGIIFALLPNGSSYYYFTDGGHRSWKDAAIELNKISNYCKEL